MGVSYFGLKCEIAGAESGWLYEWQPAEVSIMGDWKQPSKIPFTAEEQRPQKTAQS
jgi:hypothetical protein